MSAAIASDEAGDIELAEIGGYRVLRVIGTGGMADVLEARGPDGRHVAIKKLLPVFCEGVESRRVFRDEARLGERLKHRCVVRVLGSGEDSGAPYIVMELVEGADLRALLATLRAAGEPLPASLVVVIAVDMASALEYAHDVIVEGRALRVVHRDISPANVLVGVDGTVKLGDFGIARASTHEHRTRSGFVKGKVRYMPPEQARGQAVDRRSDLFSLGVVLYECLAGFRPFDGLTELDTLERGLRGDHVPLREAAPDAPLELVEIVERLLRPAPADRFASAGELLDALAQVEGPLPDAREQLGALTRRAAEPATPRALSTPPPRDTRPPSDEPEATGPARPSAFPKSKPTPPSVISRASPDSVAFRASPDSGVAPKAASARKRRKRPLRVAVPGAPGLPRTSPELFPPPPSSLLSPSVVGPALFGTLIGLGLGAFGVAIVWAAGWL